VNRRKNARGVEKIELCCVDTEVPGLKSYWSGLRGILREAVLRVHSSALPTNVKYISTDQPNIFFVTSQKQFPAKNSIYFGTIFCSNINGK